MGDRLDRERTAGEQRDQQIAQMRDRRIGEDALDVTIERDLAPTRTCQEDKMIRRDMTLGPFEKELHAPRQRRVTVRLDVETPDVKSDFDRWLAEMRLRHPYRSGPSI